MSNKVTFGGFIAAIAAAALLATPGIASAQRGGGGHFSGGGGAHFGGGGAHFGGGGAHFGGGARFAGGGAHFGGGARFAGGARFSGGHFGGIGGARVASAPHFTPRGFSAAPRFGRSPGYATPRIATTPRLNVSRGVTAPRAFAAPRGFTSSRGLTEPREFNGSRAFGGTRLARSDGAFHGVPRRTWVGPRFGYHPYWRGGWWNGYYWPRAYYGWAFPWFLPVLPVGCATFWWGGVPFYYVNSVYYIWDAGDNGYVVTNPPPIAGAAADSSADDSDASAGDVGSAPVASAPDDVYMYPENGQSQEQQSTDRYECHKWAQDQTGFDPTQPNGGTTSASPDDYRRAMIACLDARGYSAQ